MQRALDLALEAQLPEFLPYTVRRVAAIEGDATRDRRGRIHVGVLVEAGVAVIRIGDDGPGVPERLREKLFDPFTGARAEGAGLGLAIARELAAGHGGDLRLVETSPLGSVFELRLPALDARVG